MCATESPVCCTKTCPLSLSKKAREPCLERHPKHEVSRNDIPRSVRRVEDPTKSRHCAITSEMKKDRITRAPCERRRFANCPLWWQPCRHPSICMSRHYAHFNTDVGSTRRDGNCARCVAITEVSQNTNALSPRHTLFSASIRRWLSMSGNHNHHSPLCNSLLQDTDSESSVPEKL